MMMLTGQADPLGLETNDDQRDEEILSNFPRDPESFLRDAEFLPKVTKQAKAISLLFAAAKLGHEPQKLGVDPPESLDNGIAEMLTKFLESVPGSATGKKELVGSQLFAKRFAEAPSFVARKEEPQFELDQAQVNPIKKYWCTKFPDWLAGIQRSLARSSKWRQNLWGWRRYRRYIPLSNM